MRCGVQEVPGRSVTPNRSFHLAHRITGKSAVTLSQGGAGHGHEVMLQANRRSQIKNARQRRRFDHCRLTSRPTRLSRGRLAAVSRCQKSARPPGLARRGLFRIRSRSCIPAAFGIENRVLHTSLDNIGATPKHHEANLRSHIFLIAGIRRIRARGVDPGSCDQLLGRRGLQIRQYRRRLHSGHCAIDPKRIPYGSKVVFPDRACTAVDTGPAVISRKAARLCGRTASQLKAIVVDRFFETKREAMAWTNTHPHFMTLQMSWPGSHSEPPEL